jgi:hypothetical protein
MVRLLLIIACSTWSRLSLPKTVEPLLFHLWLGVDGYYPGPGTSFDRLKSLLSKRVPDREMTADPLDLYLESRKKRFLPPFSAEYLMY